METTLWKTKLYLFVQGQFLLFCYRLKIENHSLALRGPRSNRQGESASEFSKNFQAARHCRSPSASWKEKKTHATRAPRAARWPLWQRSSIYKGHDLLPSFLMPHRTRSTVWNTERRIKVYFVYQRQHESLSNFKQHRTYHEQCVAQSLRFCSEYVYNI